MGKKAKQGAFAWHGADPAQNWRTTRALFMEIQRRYGRGGFHVDLAADALNAHCPLHFSASNSAFDGPCSIDRATKTEAPAPGALQPHLWTLPNYGPMSTLRGFYNPPTEDIMPWVELSAREVRERRYELIIGLMPMRVASEWWPVAKRETSWWQEVAGRIAFIPPPEVKAKREEEGKGDTGSVGEGWAIYCFDRPIKATEFR